MFLRRIWGYEIIFGSFLDATKDFSETFGGCEFFFQIPKILLSLKRICSNEIQVRTEWNVS